MFAKVVVQPVLFAWCCCYALAIQACIWMSDHNGSSVAAEAIMKCVVHAILLKMNGLGLLEKGSEAAISDTCRGTCINYSS